MEETGLIHIYCGDGKGKTTAAIGAAVRAAGREKSVLIARFLKTDDSGEVAALTDMPFITLLPCKKSFGFSWEMSASQRQEAGLYYSQMFEEAWSTAVEKSYDMLVLDEIIGACGQDFVDEEIVYKALLKKPAKLEIIMTGRSPSKKLAELSDYMTKMVMQKHPFERGVAARRGIEY